MNYFNNFILLLILLGCSKDSKILSVVCEGDSLVDESYSFNLDTGLVKYNKTLNEYGYSQKELIYERLNKNLEAGVIQEDDLKIFDTMFSEDESEFYIRDVSDGFIVFGISKEPGYGYDIQRTLNRSSLQLKSVMKFDKGIVPEGYGVKDETVSFLQCSKPNV